MRLPALLLAPCFAAPLAAQSALQSTSGDPLNEFGRAVAAVGDVDGDGCDDVVIGEPRAPGGGVERGRVVVLSGRDGAVIYEFFGDADFHQLGYSVAGAGDLDFDGVPDVAAGSFGGNYARAWSGASGLEIDTYTSAQSGDLLGHGVAGAGDVNGDGHADLIVGSNRLIVFAPGIAKVFSGFDGSELWSFGGDSLFDGFGNAVAGGLDVDGDGVPDVVVGAPRDDQSGTDAGLVRVYSGADGTQLHLFTGDSADDAFGTSVALLDDVDGDGKAEIAVGAPGCGVLAFCATFPGYVRVFSGDTGTVLHTFTGTKGFDAYGVAVSSAGDVDGDGAGDVLVGSTNADDRTRTDNGRIEVRSGATGAVIFRRSGAASGDGIGAAVGGSGDVNGDGTPDAVYGSLAGVVESRSIRLARSTAELSLSAGGEQRLSLVAGPALAGLPVALIGTLDGTTPGLQVGAVTLPLNVVGLGNVTGALLSQAVFEGLRLGEPRWLRALVAPSSSPTPVAVRVGLLDEFGEARTALVVPPGAFASFVGQTVHHAWIAFDPVTERAILASNPVALQLVP